MVPLLSLEKAPIPVTKPTPPKPPKPEPKLIPLPPPLPEPPLIPTVQTVYVGEPDYTTTEGPIVAPQLYTQLSHFNHKYREGDILNISEIFQNTFMGHSKKSALEPGDIQTFQHGIQIRPRDGEITPSMISEIQDMLEGIPDARLIILEEDEGNSVRIVFGTPDNPLNPAQTDRSLEEKETILSELFGYISGELGDCDWMVFFDTDEALYS
jgi:hypothetical protein